MLLCSWALMNIKQNTNIVLHFNGSREKSDKYGQIWNLRLWSLNPKIEEEIDIRKASRGEMGK